MSSSRRPKKLSLEQRCAFVSGFEGEGTEYFLVHYTSPSGFEQRYGKLPKDVRDAWLAFVDAHAAMEEVLREHKAWSEDDIPYPGEDE